MSATVNVNNKTVVHKSSTGIATSFPDVCKTPSPAGPVPIPYPNIAKSADTSKGSKKTKMDGNPIMLKGSVYSTSIGDEPGTAGGVISSVNKGKAEFLNYSFDVKVEGKNVCRLADVMGQNESSLNIGGFPNFQPLIWLMGKLGFKVLLGKVKEITFESGIDLHKDEGRTPVPPAGKPHWKNEKGHPTYPAVYLKSSAGGKKELQVLFEITDLENVSGSATLSGEGGGIKVKEKSFSLKKGVIGPLKMEFDAIPDEATYFRQGINWTVKAAGDSFPLGTTNVKIFFLHDKPKKPWTSKPVWQSALEFLFYKVGVKGPDPKKDLAKITNYCHNMHNRKYDTMRGASDFASGILTGSGDFRLSGYLKHGPKTGVTINCHDQAFAVITLGEAIGIAVDYVFMGHRSSGDGKSFGFINTTNLVGVGSCNNPFFSNIAHYLPDKLCPPGTRPPHLDSKGKVVRGRSSFSNHGFCRHSGKIHDACAGPDIGTRVPNDYATNSIDVSRDYYRSPRWARGTMVAGVPVKEPSQADMTFLPGEVASVS